MSVCVFGSINMDLVFRTERLPNPGETLHSSTFETIPGGKGANQAVAAARLGTPTALVGRVGNDAYGHVLLEGLNAQGVDTTGVRIDPQTHSGIASICVGQAQGDNQIVLAAGSNGRMDATDVARLEPILRASRVLLLQLEIPLPAVMAAAKMAHEFGVFTVLDPAPACAALPEALYRWVDLITPNQTEAEVLTQLRVSTLEEAKQAAIALHQQGAKRVVITLGEQGAVAFDGNQFLHIPADKMIAVDTTAAGDAFNGAVAAAMDQGYDWETALHWGAAAGALTVSKPGAQPSLPTRETLLEWKECHGKHNV